MWINVSKCINAILHIAITFTDLSEKKLSEKKFTVYERCWTALHNVLTFVQQQIEEILRL